VREVERSELGAYLMAVEQLNDEDGGISFCLKKTVIVSLFWCHLLWALPDCEASADRVFSHCGDLTRGKRNKVTLERSVFLKVNRKLFQTVGVTQ